MLKHLRIQTPVLFAILVVLVGIFVSERFGLYEHIAHFDKIMHALGGLAGAWIALALLQDQISHLSAWKQVLIFVSFATLAGVLWEFAEFGSGTLQDQLPLLYRYFHGGDLADTMGDLAADIMGALVFSVWALRKERR